YLMYRAPTFIVEPGDWIEKANGGHVPPQIFGGRYRFLQRNEHFERQPEGGWRWALYARAADLDEFRTHRDLYLENLVHVSSVISLRINGEAIPASRLLRECPYLREEQGRFSFSGASDIDIRFSHN